MGTDVTGKEKRGAAPEPAAGAELRFDEGFELDDETVGALVSGGDGTDEQCAHKHVWKFVRREKGLLWGYNDIYKCTKCSTTKKVSV